MINCRSSWHCIQTLYGTIPQLMTAVIDAFHSRVILNSRINKLEPPTSDTRYQKPETRLPRLETWLPRSETWPQSQNSAGNSAPKTWNWASRVRNFALKARNLTPKPEFGALCKEFASPHNHMLGPQARNRGCLPVGTRICKAIFDETFLGSAAPKGLMTYEFMSGDNIQ